MRHRFFQMLCVKHARKTNATVLLNALSKVCYSRRSDKSLNSYKIIQTNNENLNGKWNSFFAYPQPRIVLSRLSRGFFSDVDGAVLGINSNWELLTPRGFRFYLPGSIGPGWSDVTTTVQVRTQLIDPCNNKKQLPINGSKEKSTRRPKRLKGSNQHSVLHCVAQECPLLLRKGIEELFPGCIDVGSPQLTIITISQSINSKIMKWNNETETEKLAKYVSMYKFVRF